MMQQFVLFFVLACIVRSDRTCIFMDLSNVVSRMLLFVFKQKKEMSSSVLGRIFPTKKKNKQGVPDEEENKLAISSPTNVKHEWHISYDQATGQFDGLPPSWTAWLEKSNIRYQMVCP